MIKIILTTISILMIAEGLILTLLPVKTKKVVKQIFKNKGQVIKIGLIEIILALLILFIISL